MGLKQIKAIVEIYKQKIEKGRRENNVLGTWHIHYEKQDEKPVFSFNKCESEVYCEERPTVFSVDGELIDAGGPLFG